MSQPASSDPTSRECMWSIAYDQLMDLDRTSATRFGASYPRMTMRDINREIIEPSCRRTGTSYALMLNPQGLMINAFVTHCWDEPFEDFVRSIRDVFRTSVKRPNLWICAFALIQGDARTVQGQVGDRDTPLSESPFVKALESASMFVVVRNSVTDLYSRIWCVCELMHATRLGLYPARIAITGPDNFANSETSCMEAQSSDPDDKEKILKELLNQYDRRHVDAIVQQFRTHESSGTTVRAEPNDDMAREEPSRPAASPEERIFRQKNGMLAGSYLN